jgi:SOS-response transcriptional repressor LexA
VVIQERRKDLYSSAALAAQVAGFSRSTMASLETGGLDPSTLSAANQRGLLKALEWSPEEFFKNTGKRLLLAEFEEGGSLSPALQPFDPDHDTEEVEFWGTVSAGNGHSRSAPLGMIRWEKDIVRKYRRYGLYALEVNGTSMYSEDMPYSIPPGAKVLIARDLEPRPTDVVVVWLPERGRHGEGVLKTWRSEDDHVVLKSWNPSVAPIVVGPEEPHHLQGVVVDVRFSPRDLSSDVFRR